MSAPEQEKLLKLQDMQEKIESLRIQIERVKGELEDVEKAIEALSSEEQKDVYQFLGKIMIKREKDAVLTELKERQEFLKLRQSGLQKQLEKLEEKAKELESEIRETIR
ncbi:MAG: prefoldin subunit [Thermoproteota archaeon]|nr:prefoldin subunit [Candidatus Brockarchaeota archaeon]MBO3763157.1 prefoldin subunit [Candidatus Brockarchaeota archaeon]MBO3768216.1 prefoldin subunit [Candidatus Brockarchaeota archaeon]MBO3801432.1 prefoldin subunit [Candidatus Brockarchaeota archaeon]